MGLFKKIFRSATTLTLAPLRLTRDVVKGGYKDPVGTLVNRAVGVVKDQAAVPLDIARTTTDSIGLTEPTEARKARQAQEAQVAEETSRAELFNAATQDNSLDEISRREILSLYQSGANSGKVASLLSAAREGKGIYAVRKINQAQQTLQKKNPGRAQLGVGTVL